MQGFDADWTIAAERVTRKGHRWKLVGNAVTVEVAEWIGRRLMSPGQYDPAGDLPLRGSSSWPRAAWNLGQGRFSAEISAYPVHRVPQPLVEFLRFPAEPLSPKATAGFLSRCRTGSLRFPAGFLDALEGHLSRSSGEPIHAII